MFAAQPAQAPPPVVREVEVAISDKQRRMIQSEAMIQWIGAGTKTGKTIAGALWIAEGVLLGEPCAWCGPWSMRNRDAYERAIRPSLEYAARMGVVRFNDSTMRVTAASGGYLEQFTGENPEAIYGSSFKRFFIDEASRQTQATLTAALTTIAVLQGRIKVAFNLEHGVGNWAIRNLQRVKKMTADERLREREDFMIFPTGGEGFVTTAYIESMRKKMPGPLFDALFNAIIPESDSRLFHNLDDIFAGPGVRAPDNSHTYIMGVDLARKRNWTVATVLDVADSRLVAATRFNTIDWPLQYEKLATFAKTWNVVRTWVDQSGLGDPVLSELERRGMAVEGVVFTPRIRRDLVEGLVVACDGKEFMASAEEQFSHHKQELEAFEFSMDKDDGKVTYSVPEHDDDDAAFSTALVWYGKKRGNFGAPRIERMRDRETFSKNDFGAF